METMTFGNNDEMLLHPIFKGRKFRINEKLCFVLMPFKEPFLRIFDQHIKPVVESLGFIAMKANDIFRPIAVVEDIWTSLNTAGLIVADVTGKNPNVFYELGIAHVIGKNTIILTQNKDDIPFDLTHLRFFEYTDNEPGCRKLEYDLRMAVKAAMLDPMHDQMVLTIADCFGERSFTVEQRSDKYGPTFDLCAYVPDVMTSVTDFLIDVISSEEPGLAVEHVRLFHSKLHEIDGDVQFSDLDIVPILVANVPPTPESVEFAERHEILLLHGDLQEIAEQICSLISRPDYEPT